MVVGGEDPATKPELPLMSKTDALLATVARLCDMTPAELDANIAVSERTLRDPRVRGAFRDRQIANGQQPWSDARLVRGTQATLDALLLLRDPRRAAA